MGPSKRLLPLAAALSVLALVGCRGAWYEARFVPSPLEVTLSAEGEPAASSRALVSVAGIRRAKDGVPAEVVVRLRIDNLELSPVALEEGGFDCVTGDLVSLGPVRLEPPAGEPLSRGQSRAWVASFPMPEGRSPEEFDWRGINFRWSVAFGDRRIATGVTFDRFLGPYDPWYDSDLEDEANSPPNSTHVSVGVSVGG